MKRKTRKERYKPRTTRDVRDQPWQPVWRVMERGTATKPQHLHLLLHSHVERPKVRREARTGDVPEGQAQGPGQGGDNDCPLFHLLR